MQPAFTSRQALQGESDYDALSHNLPGQPPGRSAIAACESEESRRPLRTHASRMAVNWLTLNSPCRASVLQPPVPPGPSGGPDRRSACSPSLRMQVSLRDLLLSPFEVVIQHLLRKAVTSPWPPCSPVSIGVVSCASKSCRATVSPCLSMLLWLRKANYCLVSMMTKGLPSCRSRKSRLLSNAHTWGVAGPVAAC